MSLLIPAPSLFSAFHSNSWELNKSKTHVFTLSHKYIINQFLYNPFNKIPGNFIQLSLTILVIHLLLNFLNNVITRLPNYSILNHSIPRYINNPIIQKLY